MRDTGTVSCRTGYAAQARQPREPAIMHPMRLLALRNTTSPTRESNRVQDGAHEKSRDLKGKQCRRGRKGAIAASEGSNGPTHQQTAPAVKLV